MAALKFLSVNSNIFFFVCDYQLIVFFTPVVFSLVLRVMSYFSLSSGEFCRLGDS